MAMTGMGAKPTLSATILGTRSTCYADYSNRSLVHRDDDEMIITLSEMGIPYVPLFPLGGFTPLQSDELSAVAAELGATPMQVALAWLLQRSPNMLLILGTSSLEHARDESLGSRIGAFRRRARTPRRA